MRLLLLLACAAFNFAVQASIPFFADPSITITGGLGWTRPGDTQELYLQEGFSNIYQNYSKQQVLGYSELFLAVEPFNLVDSHFSFGVLVSGAGMPKLNGEVWQFSDPDFNNIAYSYKLNQFRLGLRGKLFSDQILFFSQFQPFLTGSLALAWNHSFSYKNFPLINEAVASAPFANQTLIRFSYSFGLGLEKKVGEHCKFGISYEFFDWGASALGPASGQTTFERLGMSHLYVNSLLFSLSYLI